MSNQPGTPFPDAPRIDRAAISQALVTQGRVINALLLRESKSRYGQHKLGFLWALLEPLLMISVFVGILSAMRNDSPGGMALVPFMITGFVPFTMFRNPMENMQGAISSSKTLLAFPQVTTFDVILSRSLLELAVLMCVLPFMLWMSWLLGLGFELRVEDPLSMLAACLLLWVLGSGLGFVFASLSPIMPSIRQVSVLVLGRPLLLTSGMFFTAESLPPVARDWLLLNPILHALDLIRAACFYEFETDHGSWSYLCLWAGATLAVGLLVHQAVKRRAIVGL